jgi:hypothetical protein
MTDVLIKRGHLEAEMYIKIMPYEPEDIHLQAKEIGPNQILPSKSSKKTNFTYNFISDL